MFFQKNISEDLKLDRRLKVSISTCYISTFIFYLSTTIFIDHAHWRFVCHIIIFNWASYSIFSRNHTRIDWLVKNRWEKKKKKNETDKMKINSTLCFSNFSLFEHSINWLHHKATSINVINSENQSIDENRDETNEMKINSTLCFSDLLLSYADYIIKLHR